MEDQLTGFEYVSGGDQIEGYQVGWEYPAEWVQAPQTISTAEVAAGSEGSFVEVYTPFPTPKVPRPKK